MSIVTALSKAKALELAAQDIISGAISGDDLILTRRNGDVINAGNVRGQIGPQGLTGIGLIPTGMILMFANSAFIPAGGFLWCNGAAVSRTTYSALFAILGTVYGVGDGSTTFNLPNFTGKFPRGNSAGVGGGADSHGHATSQPAHTHTFTGTAHTHTTPAHSHSLSDNGQAQISLIASAPATVLRRITTTTYTANVSSNTAAAVGSTQSLSTGAALAGATDSGGSGTSGSTTAGGTNSSTTPAAGSTDVQNNIPAYTGVMFLIKY